MSLLNMNVAGLGSPVPIGVDLICNITRLISLLSRHFDTVFHEL